MVIDLIRKANSAIAQQRDRAEFDLVIFCCKFLDADTSLPVAQQLVHYKKGLEDIRQLANRAGSFWHRRWFTYGIRCVFNKPRAKEDAREMALIKYCKTVQAPRVYFVDRMDEYIFEYRCILAQIRWLARQCYQQKRHKFRWAKNSKVL